MCATCPKPHLAIILKYAIADSYILSGELRANCICVLEHAILDYVVIPGENRCALLSAIGGISEADSLNMYAIPFTYPDLIARRCLNQIFSV